MTPLKDSPFSRHFVVLTLLGAWIVHDHKPIWVNLYSVYKLIMTIVAWYGSYMLLEDLILAFGDFKKMTWNLCISTLFIGGLMKNLFSIYYSPCIDKLRWELHKDAESRQSLEYVTFHKSALKRLKFIEITYFGSGAIWIPFWLGTQYLSYLWGPKQWPVPLSLPLEIDMDDDIQYNLGFILIGMGAILGLVMVVEQEIAMFTLLIQLTREYQIFLKDIQKINKLYEDEEMEILDNNYSQKGRFHEINPFLRKLKTKMLVKSLTSRQQKLLQYTETFEYCYSNPMLIEFFGLTLIIVASLIQCIIESGKLTINLSYQLGYSVILLLNMFLVCWFSTKLHSYCFQVGEAFYSTFWYAMSIDIQKDICLVIMRSQSPPKITTGKFMVLDLNAFMTFVRNIYSTVTLYQQLEVKIS